MRKAEHAAHFASACLDVFRKQHLQKLSLVRRRTRVHLPAAERTWHTSSGINAAREREYFTSQVLRADN
jgi:hypothetical protein